MLRKCCLKCNSWKSNKENYAIVRSTGEQFIKRTSGRGFWQTSHNLGRKHIAQDGEEENEVIEKDEREPVMLPLEFLAILKMSPKRTHHRIIWFRYCELIYLSFSLIHMFSVGCKCLFHFQKIGFLTVYSLFKMPGIFYQHFDNRSLNPPY